MTGGGKTTKARTNAVLQGNYRLQGNDRFATELRLPAKLGNRQNYKFGRELHVGGNHRLQGNP